MWKLLSFMWLSVLGVKAFENVRSQIGYCGIWCGSCVVGNGALGELTGRYRQIIEGYGLEEWIPSEFDFNEFSKGLVSIQATPVCPGCRKEGGAPGCQLRACALDRGVEDCIECGIPETCDNLERLKKMRSGALDAGLKVKSSVSKREELIEEWTENLKKRWPTNILFSDQQHEIKDPERTSP